MTHDKITSTQKNRILLFALAAATYFLSTSKNALPFAGGLGPAFLVLFINHSEKRRNALFFTFLLILVSFSIKWKGYIPEPFPISQRVCVEYSLFIFLPYRLSGLFYRKDRFIKTLILPLSLWWQWSTAGAFSIPFPVGAARPTACRAARNCCRCFHERVFTALAFFWTGAAPFSIVQRVPLHYLASSWV